MTSEACVLPACNCLIYVHNIENVLVSEACLFCLLLSQYDSFKEFFLIDDRDLRIYGPVRLVFCLLVVVSFMLMTLRMF